MAEAAFRRVGRAYSGKSQKGNKYLHIKLNPELVHRITKDTITSGLYIFYNDNKEGVKEYYVMSSLEPRKK